MPGASQGIVQCTLGDRPKRDTSPAQRVADQRVLELFAPPRTYEWQAVDAWRHNRLHDRQERASDVKEGCVDIESDELEARLFVRHDLIVPVVRSSLRMFEGNSLMRAEARRFRCI